MAVRTTTAAVLREPGRQGEIAELELDELITQRYRLDEINDGYRDLMAGKNIRGAIVHEH